MAPQDDPCGYDMVNVGAESVRGRGRSVRLIGGPRDGEVVCDGAEDYAEVTTPGETERTAVWAPEEAS